MFQEVIRQHKLLLRLQLVYIINIMLMKLLEMMQKRLI